MILIYWTLEQRNQLMDDFQKYQIPEPVQENIIKTLTILDSNYAVNRNLGDDGGYVALLMPDEEKRAPMKY